MSVDVPKFDGVEVFSDVSGAQLPPAGTPVSHLWTGEKGCVPLIRPADATSTG
mgnify:CR=1 FL=1